LSDNPNAQKWRLRRAFLKIHRKYFSLADGKQEQHKFKHHRCKNERPRENMIEHG